MAIYHFSAKVISRANGSSALAAAAYRSASRLHDQRLDRHHDFSNKAGVVHSEVMLPEGAPEEFANREKLWNAVEAAEVRKDAQLAREVEFAIPRELDQAEGIRLAREFVKSEFVDRGMVADLNVHWDVGEDGKPKPHAHVMVTMREVNEDAFGPKVRDWNATPLLEQWRERWAGHVNQRLAELDIDARIDHRSLEAQGIDLEPQHKIGPAALRMVGQGLESERLVEHHAIARSNGDKVLADPAIALDAITHHQATFTTRDLAMFVHRHSEGREQFDQVMAAVRASPELVELGKDGRGEIRFTNRDMLETERRLEQATDMLAERRTHGLPAAALDRAIAAAGSDGLVLGTEQRAALEHIAKPDGLSIVVGYAGSGKSALLGVARDGWERAGYRVTGLALSGIAAENLESGSGIASRTIASIEHQWGQRREGLSSRDILVVDEAGMIGSRQMERIVREVEKRGAKLVLVGDPEQLQAIEAGAAFRSVSERHGSQEITEIRRQREDWQRDATRQLATGRTAEAVQAYEEAGRVHAAETRESARAALIERWDEDRLSHGVSTTMILTHTNAECDELNGMARDAMRCSGGLSTEYAVETTRGQALFAAGDRIMFLRNERSLDVRNGTLAIIEQVDPRRMAVRLDDGRAVRFDTKDYNDITHGYAATIHKAQGVTVDRVHVLATPGLDRHAAYVALSRHREGVELHYGRDDFETRERLVRTLSRDRSKDMASDHTQDFAERRQIVRRGDAIERSEAAECQAPRRGPFDGLRFALGAGKPERELKAPARSPFAGLRLGADQPDPNERSTSPLDAAIGRYARAHRDSLRMVERDLPELEYQKKARLVAGQLLNQVQPGAALDLDAAFAAHPALVGEAAAGRTAATIRAMQLETEVRTNPELRADRFVQTWQQLRARYDELEGWQNEAARDAVGGRMTAMAKGLGKDPALGGALVERASQLGLGRQWSPEWSHSSPDGGMAHELTDRAKARAIGMALTATLGRDRGLGL